MRKARAKEKRRAKARARGKVLQCPKVQKEKESQKARKVLAKVQQKLQFVGTVERKDICRKIVGQRANNNKVRQVEQCQSNVQSSSQGSAQTTATTTVQQTATSQQTAVRRIVAVDFATGSQSSDGLVRVRSEVFDHAGNMSYGVIHFDLSSRDNEGDWTCFDENLNETVDLLPPEFFARPVSFEGKQVGESHQLSYQGDPVEVILDSGADLSLVPHEYAS